MMSDWDFLVHRPRIYRRIECRTNAGTFAGYIEPGIANMPPTQKDREQNVSDIRGALAYCHSFDLDQHRRVGQPGGLSHQAGW